MSHTGKRRFPGIVESVIESKPGIAPATVATLRTDAGVILESLVAEFSEAVVLAALRNQGVSAETYRATLLALAEVARIRRAERLAGVEIEDV